MINIPFEKSIAIGFYIGWSAGTFIYLSISNFSLIPYLISLNLGVFLSIFFGITFAQARRMR